MFIEGKKFTFSSGISTEEAS